MAIGIWLDIFNWRFGVLDNRDVGAWGVALGPLYLGVDW